MIAMAVNKVIYGTTVLVDLTADTVSANKLISGATAHDKAGNSITGTVVTQVYRVGSGLPDDSVGKDGDLYFDMG